MKRFLLGRLGWILAIAVALVCLSEPAFGVTCTQTASVTLTGNLRSANGIPLSNGVMTLVPSQQGFIAGCGVNLATPNFCATSTDGSVVGIQNPLTATINTSGGLGTLPPATYYTVYAWYDASGNITLPSPETISTVSMTSELTVNPPSSGIPAGAVGMKVYISTTSGTETLQGSTTGSASFVQSVALVSGASPVGTNSTICQVVANDAVWPTGTGYNVSLTDKNGNGIPGYPMQWQLMGPGTTYNLSNGLPYYHGVVYYPVPILSQPANHGQQSISGPLSFGGYNVTQIGRLGVGTGTPGYGVDVEGAGINGVINAKTGYLINGNGGTTGQALCSDGTYLDTLCNFIPATTVFYYQTVQANAVDQTQRAKLNFSSRFALSDSSSPSRTTVELGTAGTPGTYSNPTSITTDVYGRVTAVAVLPGTQKDYYFTFTGCSLTTRDNLNTCAGSIDFTTSTTPTYPAMPDTNYLVMCAIDTGTQSTASFNLTTAGNLTSTPSFSRTTTGFQYNWTEVMANNAGASDSPQIDCHLHHP